MTRPKPDEDTSAGRLALLDSLKALGPAKLAAMGLVAVGMLCMLAILVLRGGGTADDARMALLYGDLDLHEAGQMADLLDKAHIPHQVSGQGDQIMVPSSDVASARLLLAKSSLPSGGSVGYEIFDHSDALTSTQFDQEINQTRALEGELVRSITLIQGVKGARVHLVLPHRDLFAQQDQPAQASVLLSLRGATRLEPEAIQAILNLVSAAVPGLKPQSIAVIDNHGSVLARNGAAASDELGSPGSVEELRQVMEARLSRSVEDMLDASLGPNKVHAEAAVTLDDAAIHEIQESYDPDQQVLRSQQTSSDKTRATEPQQNTSVQNNLPNADAGRSQAGSQEDKRDETNNYEIGKTVRTSTRTAPRVQRISLAVLVDDDVAIDRNGIRTHKSRSQAELSRMTDLVKSAIGYDAKRGDVVTVQSMQFNDQDETVTAAPTTTFLGLGLANADLVRLGQTALLGFIILVIGLFVFRPMIIRLTSAEGLNGASPLAVARARQGHAGSLTMTGDRLLLTGPEAGDGHAGPGSKQDVQMLTQFEISQNRNLSTRRLGELVEQYPEESLTLVRAWLAEGTA